jgi:hypothetical protein
MKEAFAIIASLLAIVGNIPYLRDVIKNKIEPHPYTWFVWTIVSAVTFFGQISKGAGIGALPTAAAEIFTVIIFFLSIKNGFKHIIRTDTYFMIFALLGIIPWIISRDPTISVITVVCIDLIAFIPTIRKTWKHPHLETPILYGSNVLRHILALISLHTYNIATTLHSIAMIFTNTIMTMIIMAKNKRK